MTRMMLAATVLGLSGCQKLDDLKSTVEGLTERFVIEGIYLGSAPFDGEVDLEEAGFGGAKVIAYLADASQVTEIEQAPITGVDLRLVISGNGSSILDEDGSGKYSLNDEGGLDYLDNATATLSATYDGEDRQVQVTTPAAADLSALDIIQPVGTPMVIDLSGQGYDTAMVVVIASDGGEVTYSNEPTGIEDLYEMTHPDGISLSDDEEVKDDNLLIEIPERAFAQEGVYAVGVAGLYTSGTDDMTGVNTAISTMIAGRFRFVTVCTEDYEKLCFE